MGCWNGTCGLSQLPILNGEKIVLFIIEKDYDVLPDHGGFCYSTDIYRPVSTPIFGEYNDYGGIENIVGNQSVLFQFFMKQIRNGNYNSNKKETPKNLEHFINDFIERGEISNLRPFMVLESVYRKVIEEFGSRTPYNKVQSVREIISKQAIGAQNNFVNPNELFSDEDDILFHREMMVGKNRNNRFASFFTSYETKLSDLYEEILISKNDKMLDSLIDLYLFSSSMSFLRKLWIPQAGCGSQSRESFLHKVIAEAVIEHHDNYKSNYLDEIEVDFDNIEEKSHFENLTKETIFFF